MRQKGFIGTTNRLLSVALAGVLIVSAVGLSACGANKMTAIVMRLMESKGQVVLTDEKGADKTMMENMNLYSGYHIKTGSDSKAQISLDDTRLATLSENSLLGFEKEKKALKLILEEGDLFFNVTEKLEEDESCEVETSTMIVGIRGTSVYITDEKVVLTNGTISIKIKDPESKIKKTVTLEGGQQLKIVPSTDEVGKNTYLVEQASVEELPEFVKEAILNDTNLAEKVAGTFGITKEELVTQIEESMSDAKEETPEEEEEEEEDESEEEEEEDDTQAQRPRRRQETANPEETDPNEMTPEQLAAAQAQLAKEMAEKAAADAAAAAAAAAAEEPASSGPVANTVSVSFGTREIYWRDGSYYLSGYDNGISVSGSGTSFSCNGLSITTLTDPTDIENSPNGYASISSVTTTVYINSGQTIPSYAVSASQTFGEIGDGYYSASLGGGITLRYNSHNGQYELD